MSLRMGFYVPLKLCDDIPNFTLLDLEQLVAFFKGWRPGHPLDLAFKERRFWPSGLGRERGTRAPPPLSPPPTRPHHNRQWDLSSAATLRSDQPQPATHGNRDEATRRRGDGDEATRRRRRGDGDEETRRRCRSRIHDNVPGYRIVP